MRVQVSPRAACFFCLFAFLVLSAGSAWRESATYDEPLHITSGYLSWKQGYHALDSNPPLINAWMALPLLARPLRLPAEGSQAYLQSPRTFSFLFVFRNAVPPDTLLNGSRLMIVFLGVLLGYLLFRWADEAMGPLAAIATLVAYSFCPALLAHAHLATADMGSAFFSTLTLYAFWRWQKRPSSSRMALAGAAYGLALCSKYSAIVAAPFAMLALGLELYAEGGERRWDLKEALLQGGLFWVCAWAVMAVCYGGLGFPSWVAGFRDVFNQIKAGHPNFFLSRYGESGWPGYFLVAFLLKTPIPFLLLTVMGLGRFKSSASGRFAMRWAFLPAALWVLSASFSPTQVGLRHILAAYPLLCLWVGSAAASAWAMSSPHARAIVAALGVWYVGATWVLYPRYLSYFNEAVGGPSQGHRYLLDSNLDWGQGLKALGAYLRREEIPHVYLSYFGCADPHAYGIRYTPVANVTCAELPGDGGTPESPGKKVLFAISATNRGGVYYRPHTAFDWLNRRRPARVLLDSIWVYDITEDPEARQRLRMLAGASKRSSRT